MTLFICKFCWFATKILSRSIAEFAKTTCYSLESVLSLQSAMFCLVFHHFPAKVCLWIKVIWTLEYKKNQAFALRPVKMLSEQGKIYNYYFKITGFISVILNMIIILSLSFDFLLLGVFFFLAMRFTLVYVTCNTCKCFIAKNTANLVIYQFLIETDLLNNVWLIQKEAAEPWTTGG